MLLILIPILIFSDTAAIVVAACVVTVIGEFELLHCLGLHKNIAISLPVYAIAIAMPIAARYMERGFFYEVFFSLSFLAILIMIAVFTFSKGKISLEQIGAAAAFSIYIAVGISSIILTRDRAFGEYIYLLIFVGAYITDTFAYFVGRLIGKHKLIPDVSPKKTVEGSLGGTLFCVISFIAFGFIMKAIDPRIIPNYLVLALAGLLSAVISQVGDLVMSALKRARGIKDFGNIFPGHGGVLDRIDSVLAVSIVILAVETFFDIL